MKALTIFCCSLYFGGGIKVLYGSCMGSLQACHSVFILQREIKQSTTHIKWGMIKSRRKKKIEVGGYVETKVEKSKVDNIYET